MKALGGGAGRTSQLHTSPGAGPVRSWFGLRPAATGVGGGRGQTVDGWMGLREGVSGSIPQAEPWLSVHSPLPSSPVRGTVRVAILRRRGPGWGGKGLAQGHSSHQPAHPLTNAHHTDVGPHNLAALQHDLLQLWGGAGEEAGPAPQLWDRERGGQEAGPTFPSWARSSDTSVCM